MTRRLVLVRHAQAEDNHPRGDHERVLTDAGVADATVLGGWLAEQGLGPEHVLVSTAERARQTLAALRRGLGGDGLGEDEVWPDRRVYDGGTDGVLDAMHEVPASTQVLWVVGHEPVMSATTWQLADGRAGSEALLRRLSRGLPTATAAVLEVAADWTGLGAGDARPVLLHTGRGS